MTKLFLASTVLSVNYRKTSHLSVSIRMGPVTIIQCHVHAVLGRVPLSLISEKKGKGHIEDNPADPKILPKSDGHVDLSHSTTEAGTAHAVKQGNMLISFNSAGSVLR